MTTNIVFPSTSSNPLKETDSKSAAAGTSKSPSKVTLDFTIFFKKALEEEGQESSNFDKFFTVHGGFLHFEKNKWVLIRKPIQKLDLPQYFQKLASDMVSHLCIEGTGGYKKAVLALITKVNILWTKTRGAESNQKESQDCNSILFKARDPKFGWLSNCFPTLIYNKDRQQLFISVETAYQSAALESSGNAKLALSVATSANPMEAMKKAKREIKIKKELQAKECASQTSHDHNGSNMREKVTLLTKLTFLKYQQNPELQKMLLGTCDALLVEHTSNPIWGDGSHGETSVGTGENRFGKILMAVRKSLSKTESSKTLT